jgi:hypothetical protein
MPLRDYVATLQALIATIPFVTATSFSYEERPPSTALIKGNILFADNSQLDFREFLIFQPTVQVIKYAYNYRKGDHLIFRYDNANDPAARNLSSFPLHKHIGSDILATEKPSFEMVLKEIVNQLKFP